jgi:hypothetical protein
MSLLIIITCCYCGTYEKVRVSQYKKAEEVNKSLQVIKLIDSVKRVGIQQFTIVIDGWYYTKSLDRFDVRRVHSYCIIPSNLSCYITNKTVIIFKTKKYMLTHR